MPILLVVYFIIDKKSREIIESAVKMIYGVDPLNLPFIIIKKQQQTNNTTNNKK